MGAYENLTREQLVDKLTSLEEVNTALQTEIERLQRNEHDGTCAGDRVDPVVHKKLFENMPMGYVRQKLILNEDGKPIDYQYLMINPEFEKLMGRTKDEIIGKRASEIGAYDTGEMMTIFNQVAFHDFHVQVDYHVQRLKKVFNTVLYSPVKGEFVALFLDVSDLKRTEIFLKDNAARLSLMLEAGNIFPWYLDVKSGRLDIGDEFFDMYEVKRDDFSNDFYSVDVFINSIHPDDRGIFLVIYEKLLEGSLHKISVEIRLDVLNTGNYMWVDLKGVTQESDHQGKAIKVLGFLTDIQKRKDDGQALIEAKVKAEESDRLKSAFLANVSHEIRTPLNAIVGFSEIIANTEEREERENYLEIVKANSNLLLHLINDILDLSRIESNRMDFVDEEIRLDDLCDELRQIHQMRIKNDVQVVFEKPEISLMIISDSHRMRQLYSNLISNAIKYTTTGSITLGYRLNGEFVEGFVRDTGSGIPADKLDNVFGRFEKLDVMKQGFGLGLSICKSILDRMGGRIWVESTVGIGSCFYFTIPYKGIQSVSGGKSKPVILIAEDLDCNYELIRAILEDRYALMRANDGIEVITKFEAGRPDLVLMDVRMPGLDGLTAAGIIREMDSVVPIVATTAFAYETDRDMALAAGCTEYVSKPLEAEKLKTILERCLKNKL